MFSDPGLQSLAEADPAAGITLSPIEAHHLLRTTLEADSEAVAAPTRNWRSRAARIGIGAAAIGVAVPTLAFAASFLAQTGMFNHPGGENGPGTSEMINLLAPDYVDYAVTQWPAHVRLPASFDTREFARTRAQAIHDNAVASNAAEEHPSDASFMAVDGIRADFETAALCVWQNQWLSADAGGDRAAAAKAATMLEEATTWKYTVIFTQKESMEYLREVAAGAAAGDRGIVQDAASDCPAYTLTPDGGR